MAPTLCVRDGHKGLILREWIKRSPEDPVRQEDRFLEKGEEKSILLEATRHGEPNAIERARGGEDVTWITTREKEIRATPRTRERIS